MNNLYALNPIKVDTLDFYGETLLTGGQTGEISADKQSSINPHP